MIFICYDIDDTSKCWKVEAKSHRQALSYFIEEDKVNVTEVTDPNRCPRTPGSKVIYVGCDYIVKYYLLTDKVPQKPLVEMLAVDYMGNTKVAYGYEE